LYLLKPKFIFLFLFFILYLYILHIIPAVSIWTYHQSLSQIFCLFIPATILRCDFHQTSYRCIFTSPKYVSCIMLFTANIYQVRVRLLVYFFLLLDVIFFKFCFTNTSCYYTLLSKTVDLYLQENSDEPNVYLLT